MTPGHRARPDSRLVLVDDVHEAIKARIMDHAIAPGARLSIDGLARELGVSPTPVREALARLESAQLVVKEPLRGYRTTPLLTPGQLADLYRFRLLIEPWAAATAAERADPAGRARLKAELATTDAPDSDTYAAYRAFSAHDARFHLLLAELAGSDQVRDAFQRTNWHLRIYRQYYDRGIGPQALAEHRRIADAVLACDPAAAADAMRAHLELSHARLRQDDHGEAPAESERAGAVPRGRRAGSEERAPEHRRSGTAPGRPASPPERSGGNSHRGDP